MLTTTPLPREFQDLLKLFNAQGLKYLVVGGWAVGHYGHTRHTDDIDFWIAVSPENADRLIRALNDFIGVAPTKHSIIKLHKTTQFGFPPLKVHIMCNVSGVDFDSCYANRDHANWDGIIVPIIGRNDLEKNKKAAGRFKDLADIDTLKKLKKLSKRKKP